jgi:hypothetical protein
VLHNITVGHSRNENQILSSNMHTHRIINFLTNFLLELHPPLCVVVPVKQLLLLYELGALSIRQLSSKVLRLKQVQEM